MNNTIEAPSANFGPYFITRLATAICLAILSPVTIVSNSLLLLAILKDPLKCFRTPKTYFVVALALADLMTGLFVEPFTVVYRMAQYVKWNVHPGEPYKTLLNVGNTLSYIGLNASFLLVLELIWCQYIAIIFPFSFQWAVTTRRVLACITLSWAYFIAFVLVLKFSGVSPATLYKVDLHLHTTLITVLLVLGTVCLLRSFRKCAKESRRLASGGSVEGQNTIRARQGKSKQQDQWKQFTIVTLLLSIILVVCSLPHIICIHIELYRPPATLKDRVDLNIATTIAYDMMNLKVALDAFIFAWISTKYRRSLKIVLNCSGNRVS